MISHHAPGCHCQRSISVTSCAPFKCLARFHTNSPTHPPTPVNPLTPQHSTQWNYLSSSQTGLAMSVHNLQPLPNQRIHKHPRRPLPPLRNPIPDLTIPRPPAIDPESLPRFQVPQPTPPPLPPRQPRQRNSRYHRSIPRNPIPLPNPQPININLHINHPTPHFLLSVFYFTSKGPGNPCRTRSAIVIGRAVTKRP